jgi:hypothetical protein
VAITLAELRLQARQRADMENSKFVQDSELNNFINNSIAELYDIIVEAYASEYYVVSTETAVAQDEDDIDLPSDFYVMKGVDIKIDNQDFISLRPFNFNERNRYSELGVWDLAGITNVRYRIIGDKLRFTPRPDRNATVRIWYVPVPAQLVDDADTFNDINSFAEYVIVDAAIKMMQKEESDVTVLMTQKMALEKRIRDRAKVRDASSAQSISDIYAEGDDFYWRNGK